MANFEEKFNKLHNRNMNNIMMKGTGNYLTIVIDLEEEARLSRSGKTMVVATTGGEKKIQERPDIFISINCYKKFKKDGNI